MPIKIPNNLPARKILEKENIFVMTEKRALKQDIRPLKIVLLNLMPTKIETETQIMRCFSNTPLQIEVTLLQTSTYRPKNASPEHLLNFYETFDNIKENRYDGMIITGAPVEDMPFEQVAYYDELCRILQWSNTNVHSTFHICWGAQAGLYYHYGIDKHYLPEKAFGVFPHTAKKKNVPLFRGFDDVFYAPHSRHTTVLEQEIRQVKQLEILATSKEVGVYIAASRDGRQIFVTGHSEYDPETLATEYFRDVDKGLKINMPVNYFKGNNPLNPPHVSWRAHGSMLFTNWLNYYVYQTTPYDLDTEI